MTTTSLRRSTHLRNCDFEIEILVEEKIHRVDVGVQNAARVRKCECLCRLPRPALRSNPRQRVDEIVPQALVQVAILSQL
jgi:hypothetical protein